MNKSSITVLSLCYISVISAIFQTSYYNGDYVSVCYQNYITTDITIPLVIYVKFSKIIK